MGFLNFPLGKKTSDLDHRKGRLTPAVSISAGLTGVVYMNPNSCPQISHLAGSATAKLPGTAKGSSQKAHFQRERRLKLQTPSSLSKNVPCTTSLTRWTGCQQNTSLSSELTTTDCLDSSVSNTKSCRTIRSFGWQSSSARRLTWTASSFYRTGPKSVLPPHSVVRRRTSSLVTQSNDASSATYDTTERPAVVPSSPTSVSSAKTR